jgi:putative tricarboxylic transport membrane protein
MKKSIVVCLLLTLIVSGVFAQGSDESATKWANKVEVYVPAKAGGGTDVMARTLATQIAKETKRSLTIINNTDGGGVVPMEAVRNAKPDGSKILQFHTTMLIKSASGLYNKKAAEDFTVLGVSYNPDPSGWILVVGANSPYNTVQDLINASKTKQLLMGVETGGTIHLITGMLALETGANFKYVEAGSDTEKLTALVGGSIDGCFVNVNQARQYLEAEKVKGLVLLSSDKAGSRNPIIPSIPSLVELGIDVYFSSVNLFLGPKGMDPAIVNEIYDSYSKAALSDEVNKILIPANFNMVFFPQEEGIAFIREQQAMLDRVVAELGLAVK